MDGTRKIILSEATQTLKKTIIIYFLLNVNVNFKEFNVCDNLYNHRNWISCNELGVRGGSYGEEEVEYVLVGGLEWED